MAPDDGTRYGLVRRDAPIAPTRPWRRAPGGRDVLRPIFRYGRAALTCFLVASLAIALAVIFWPKRYTAEMELLVKGADQSSQVTDAILRAEIELLKSQDLLQAVAAATGMGGSDAQSSDARLREAALARAVHRLEPSLAVAPVRGAAMISVSYTAEDPVRAKSVLTELLRRYLDKRATVEQSAGAMQFFTEQAARLQRELRDAEQRLVDFGRESGVVDASKEKSATLDKLAELEASLQDLRAQAAEATRRGDALRRELAATPARQTTVLRTEDNAALIRDLKAKVLELELKRTELVRKFNDTYPLVIEINQQLQNARAALASAERAPVKTETTDQNPTHQWLANELSRVGAERQALEARAAAVERSIELYRDRARQLDERSMTQQDLQRQVASAQEKYLLYQRKTEDTKIAGAIHLATVSVAEEPTMPAGPVSHAWLAGGGILAAAVLSVLLTFFLDWFNPRFRSPEEVWTVLEVPVLAALPPAD